jgi:NAD(P)-dependent dehydrogenase (short-subunit alcohol dehydrogenase family)
MDKVVVITGASAGIGAALAEECARRGARVVLAARRHDLLDQVARRCGEALAVEADMTVRADVERTLGEALARFGRVDVWVNNVGRGITRPVSQLTDDDLDEMIRVNVKSALYGIQAVLPHMRDRGTGQIVNVSSMLGRVPFFAPRSAYSAAKHALNALTTNLYQELRETAPGIMVTLVLPGVVATEFGTNALHGGPDSRALPDAQPVDEVAKVIADAIDEPRHEVYTRPAMRDAVLRFYGGGAA